MVSVITTHNMKKIVLFFLFLISGLYVQAQCELNPVTGELQYPDGTKCPNAIPTAVPFLSITPDARSGAMGDAGIAISGDANAIAYNISRLAFAEEDAGISLTYTPWLKNIGLNDVFLGYVSGYTKIDDFQAVTGSLRYFSLGEIQYTDENGMATGFGSPNEFEVSLGYARLLAENLSVGVGGKFIYSNLASNQTVNGSEIQSGIAGAADISLLYKLEMEGYYENNLNIGLSLRNLGSKISYVKDRSFFIPANIGLGLAYEMNFDEYNKLTLTTDINKLMVPTPQVDSTKQRESLDASPISSWFNSFGDAPTGFKGEMRELTFSFGAEYWYADQFAVRAGYFYESPLKGNRKYLTAGLGIKYNIVGINLAYLLSTQNTLQSSSPLDKTLRFSILFNFGDAANGRRL